MSKVLLDTDVLIDHLRGYRPLVAENGAISVITRAELFAGDERQEHAVEALLGDYEELGIDRQIARRAGRIKRQTGLKIADALIAATALEHQLALVTRNRRHFGQVSGLSLLTPNEPTAPPATERPAS